MSQTTNKPQQGVFRNVRQSPEWKDDKFVNSVPTTVATATDMLSVTKRYIHRVKNSGKPGKPIPVKACTRATWPQEADPGLALTWLGHAGFLIELEGAFILLDPMMGPNPSPFYGLGPGRLHEPPCAVSDLPEVDAVVLSHDHYDHLDKRSIKQLALKAKLFLVPIGVGPILKGFGVPLERIVELDWHEAFSIKGIKITCLPARHFSGRGITGRDRTLWASYAFTGHNKRLYFSGDTGEQTEVFEDIGDAFGPFDAAIMAIGAYDPLWHDIHVNPEEAVEGFEKLKARLFVPCHWATFDLAVHGWANPALRLEKVAEARHTPVAWPLPGERFRTESAPKAVWWRDLVTEGNAMD